MSRRVVVLDANVLDGIVTTDLLLTIAVRHMFRPHWSAEILDELIRGFRVRHDLCSVSRTPCAILYIVR